MKLLYSGNSFLKYTTIKINVLCCHFSKSYQKKEYNVQD